MKKIRGFRWWIVALICLGTIINYLARNSLAVLAPELQTRLNFTTQEYSYIVGAFQIGYTVMQSVCGFALDDMFKPGRETITLHRRPCVIISRWALA
jgi:ACS family hexuronate transporter-like MFS transporter